MVNFETVHLKIECYIKSVNPSLNSRNFWCELMQAMARARAAATTGQHTGNMFCVRRFRGAGTFAYSWWPRKQDPTTIMNKNICLESSSNLTIQCLVLTFFHRIWMYHLFSLIFVRFVLCEVLHEEHQWEPQAEVWDNSTNGCCVIWLIHGLDPQ